VNVRTDPMKNIRVIPEHCDAIPEKISYVYTSLGV
jgi:hypothetical protein